MKPPQKLSEKFNMPPDTLWNHMVNLWVRYCLSPDDGKAFVEVIKSKL